MHVHVLADPDDEDKVFKLTRTLSVLLGWPRNNFTYAWKGNWIEDQQSLRDADAVIIMDGIQPGAWMLLGWTIWSLGRPCIWFGDDARHAAWLPVWRAVDTLEDLRTALTYLQFQDKEGRKNG